MIELHLAIYEGDAQMFQFESTNAMVEYLEELRMFDNIWLATTDSPDAKEEIMITENLEKILLAIAHDHWDISLKKHSKFFVQEYQTYEAAYDVALSMREPNPKCYE